MTDREAACSCGQLRLGCRGEPVLISMVFGVQAWFASAQVDPARGLAKQFVRQADSGRRVIFSFCPECGGTVFWTAALRPDLIAIAVGAFADPNFGKPGHSLWESRKHPWTGSIGGPDMKRLA